MEGLILDKTILRRLGNGEIAAFERVGKRDSCCLTGYHSYPFGGLRLIAIFGQLSDFINARAEIFQQESPVRLGTDILIDAITADVKRDVAHFAVLAGLYQLDAAGGGFYFQKRRDRVVVSRDAGHHILVFFLLARDAPDQKAGGVVGGWHFSV